MLELIGAEIKYCAIPVEELIRNLSSRSELKELKFIKSCCEYCESGTPFPLAFKKALENRENTGDLLQEDISLLISFGNQLGTTDAQGQISICEYHKELIRQNLKAANENKNKQAKLYSNLGLIVGIAVAIVLI